MYDGAASVSGHINGLLAHILIINEKAVYTHCYSYQLNLAVAASCSIQYVRNALDQIKEVFFFFNFSEPFLDISIENHASDCLKKKLKNVCRTRWLSRSQGWMMLRIFMFQLYFA